MLDPKIIRDEPEKIRKMLKNRAVDFDFDGLIEADKKRRALIIEVDNLRKRRNELSLQISEKKKSQQDVNEIVSEVKSLGQTLTNKESEQNDVQDKYDKLIYSIPNLIDESVPIGADDSANIEIRKWGKPNKNEQIQNHVDFSVGALLVDLERAAKVAGARFYYLKGGLLKLNQALIHYALKFLEEKNYKLVQPPFMINRKAMEGAVIAEDFEDVIYKIENEDLYLIGTSEHAVASMHSDEILEGKDLPIRYAGFSPCFRKEAGAHGKDQKGIFRVHQFEKVEQFVFSRPEDSGKEHERMLKITEEFYKKLEIPYKVMLLSSGDMGKVSAKTFDIEAWMGGQKAYREIVSCSNCLDFQARRLKIRFRDKTNEETQYLHTLNSTLVATERTLVAIMEHFQFKDKDGNLKIKIPEVLREYVGQDTI